MKAAKIKEYNSKIATLEKEMPKSKENKELMDKNIELERYRRRWNLKIQGLKEKDREETRNIGSF